ncbi:hyaluronidase PH-20 [Pteropus medius]|uniref:hyaluronidase PH-20 n=1 Tax=Pteropus vampyrus TaxID=132908 RepID=UPI00196AFB3A|nr:hyaluronidase PH-20 [Pteropus giganteus]
MKVLRFNHIFFRSFVRFNGASQLVLTFLLIPGCLTSDFIAPPFLSNDSFLWIWNAPTESCATKFKVQVDLSLFSLIGTPKKDTIGQPIILFYVDRLGLYPYIEKNGTDVNGGLPQVVNLEGHLNKAKNDIPYYIPKDDVGLAVIDWEEWRPLWARNWKPKDIYRNKSIQLVQEQNPQLSVADATNLAKQNFETAGKAMMLETLKLGKSLRPKRLWGYYLFPDCYNHHYTKPNYNGSCFFIEKKRNDELGWLWSQSTALFPSIYLNSYLRSSPLTALFVRNRVQEAIRVSKASNAKSPLPVFIYTRPVFTDKSSQYLGQDDLVNTLGETVALGVSGIIMWGSLNLSQNLDSCNKLQNYMKTTLNPYIINITLAAKMCSQVFCQEQGLCVRKNWNSLDYLHLNPMSLAIETEQNGKFKIKGKPTLEDLKEFSEKFHCRCYVNTSCAKKVNLKGTHTINVCASEGVCINATLKSENELFHSNLPQMHFRGHQDSIFNQTPVQCDVDNDGCEPNGRRSTFLVAIEKASWGPNEIILELKLED